MCGIYFGKEVPSDSLLESLQRRGPDHQQTIKCHEYILHSTVLHMRGDSVTPQPLCSDRFVLQWNGEIFGFSPSFRKTAKEVLLWTRSDTQILFDLLNDEPDDIINLLMSIEGPFAVLILDIRDRVVFYGRDRFGRRSLVHKATIFDGIVLSSVVEGSDGFEEVSAEGIHKISLDDINKQVMFPYPKMTTISKTVSTINTDYTDVFINMMKESINKRLVHVGDTVTVLFSGGVDSLLIAALLCVILGDDKVIELVNVAFSNDSNFDTVPDRQTGLLAYKELRSIFKQSNISFTPQNVSFQDYLGNKEHVLALMRPNVSVMDESIAMALWFAAMNVKSRVLMVGMGADEQFGGYTRHSTRFRREGYDGLLSELQLDVDRIASRNLGRDDRVISDHGVEGRYPFLCEHVVQFSSLIPLDQKMHSSGENKWIIRQSLRRLGFSEGVACATKRAIQFGARTAKMQQISPQ